MRFWEIREPECSDYEHVHVSGKLYHPFRLPGLECDYCGQSVCSLDVQLPYECPNTMRKHPLLTDHDAEVPTKEFQKLERDLVAELHKAGIKKPQVVPGASLQPGFLDIPSVPKSDFLWSSLWSGLSSIAVSERVRDLLVRQAAKSVALCPVIPRKIGKRSARSTPRVPRSGEPEDALGSYRASKGVRLPRYYQLLVVTRSGYPPGTEPGPACRACGTELQDWKSEKSQSRKRSRMQEQAWEALTVGILESVWSGAPIFQLADRGMTLVTDPLKVRLEEMKASNVTFREYPVAQHLTGATSHRRSG